MEKQMKPLSAAEAVAYIRAAETGRVPTKPQRLAPGLYLTPQARAADVRWIALLRWTLGGKADNKSLGTYDRTQHAHYLAQALRCREAQRAGLDPHSALDAGDGGAPGTFAEAAEDYIKNHVEVRVTAKGGSRKNADNKARCIRRSCAKLGHLQLTAIGPKDIRRVLAKDWNQHVPSSRNRLQRIAAVINHGFTLAQIFDRANPAEWKRAVVYMGQQKEHEVKHRRWLPAAEIPACFRELGSIPRNGWRGCGAAALRFMILTGARGREVRLMEWADLDLEGKVWKRPKLKMKTRIAHSVPLSEPALALIREQQRFARGPFVFQGQMVGTGLSENTLCAALARTSIGKTAQPHGFRSSLVSWWREPEVKPRYDKSLIDDALAHVRREEEEKRSTDKVFRSYDQALQFKARRALMEEWAHFVTGTTEARPLALVA